VVSVFLLRERIFAVIDLIIQPEDTFAGQAVRALAVDYRLLPVTVVSGGRATDQPLAVRLGPGDRLVALVALADLERLLRRQPSSAEFAVDVVGFLRPTRGWLAGLVRTMIGSSAEEADHVLDRLPFRLADGLTRGQAEDLLSQLARERVDARLSPAGREGPGAADP
jgi:hypothetical protein